MNAIVVPVAPVETPWQRFRKQFAESRLALAGLALLAGGHRDRALCSLDRAAEPVRPRPSSICSTHGCRPAHGRQMA